MSYILHVLCYISGVVRVSGVMYIYIRVLGLHVNIHVQVKRLWA